MAKRVTELRVGAKRDVGLKRDHNEDDFVVVEQWKSRETWPIAQRKGNLYIVADGMGGHNAGEVASRMAVDAISEEYYRDETGDITASLQQAVETANQRIHDRAKEVETEAGMGSTVVAAVIRGDELHIAHVGDSRIYLVRAGKITQLTADHSWVGEQLAAKLITPEQARTHPYRNLVSRSLGIKPEVEVDIDRRRVREGDIVVLCSDGLSGPVTDEQILRTVTGFDPEEACEELVRQANEAGGPDNITAVVIRVEKVVPVTAGGAVPAREAVLGGRERERSEPPAKAAAAPRREFLPLLTALAAVAALVGFLLAGLLWLQTRELRERNQALTAQMEQTGTALAAVPTAPSEPSPAVTAPQPAQVYTETPAPTATFTPEPVPTETPVPPTLPPTLPPTDTPVPTTPPTATLTPTTSPSLTPSPTLTPTGTTASTVLPSGTPAVVPTFWLEVKPGISDVQVRTGPGTLYGSLGEVNAGDRLNVIGKHPSTNWLKVCCVGPNKDIEGWLLAAEAWVTVSVRLNELPVVPFP